MYKLNYPLAAEEKNSHPNILISAIEGKVCSKVYGFYIEYFIYSAREIITWRVKGFE